jgi:imidazolonepropionase-like amidohydrolase
MIGRSTILTFMCACVVTVLTLLASAQGQGQGAGTPAPPAQGRGAAPGAGGTGRGQGGRGGGGQPITIRAARVLDGAGNVLENGVVEVQGSKISKIDQRTGPVTYDLGDATLLPGLIDVHVHLNWYFGPDGRYGGRGVLQSFVNDAILENARATVMAGFTTIQSVGAAVDKPLRAAAEAGLINSPRIVTSLTQIQGGNATPDQLRDRVRQAKADGADLIKFFASASIRDGGKMNVTQDQVNAVCDEAKKLGLRTLVHAHSADSIIASVKAGCTQIEHGLFADDAAIKAMADAHTYFDPNIGLVLQNYLEHREEYDGSGNFNEDSFAAMQAAIPGAVEVFKKALAAGLKMPLGTDAVAGAHGHNAREIIARVQKGGQKPMDAIIGATSLSAESMNLGSEIGSLKVGYEADIIAVPGDPAKDITRLRDVTFVMKGGRLLKK